MAIYYCLITPFHTTHVPSAQMNTHLPTSDLSLWLPVSIVETARLCFVWL